MPSEQGLLSPLTHCEAEAWTLPTLCPPVQWQDSHENPQTAQPQCSATWQTRLWMAASLNTLHPIAHNIPAAHQLRQEQCVWNGHGPRPSFCRAQAALPRGRRGMEQGEQHRPNHLLIPHKASRNVIFACNLSQMHCAVCPPHAHPTCLSPTAGTARGSSSSFTQSHFGSVSVP